MVMWPRAGMGPGCLALGPGTAPTPLPTPDTILPVL